MKCTQCDGRSFRHSTPISVLKCGLLVLYISIYYEHILLYNMFDKKCAATIRNNPYMPKENCKYKKKKKYKFFLFFYSAQINTNALDSYDVHINLHVGLFE